MPLRKVFVLMILALTCMLGLGNYAQGQHYGRYDPDKLLIPADPATGKAPALNVTYLDIWIRDLAVHAKDYPARFATETEKSQAIKDVTLLAGLLDILNDPKQQNTELLRRAALVNSMGHNLDVAGTAQKAKEYFERLLIIAPNDPQANQMYGMFLAGVGRPDEAIPYLQRAETLGLTSAIYSLGMTYLSKGDKQKAIEYLERYHKAVPEDKSLEPLLEGIKNGRVEIITSDNGNEVRK